MIYVLLGLVSATLFGFVSFSVYGYEALLNDLWIDYVFWWLIGTGVVLAALDSDFRFRCEMCRRIPRIVGQTSTPQA